MSQKVETTRGVPLEFSPFCNPLSLTPVASHNLMTKSWFCRELNKNLSDAVNQMAEKENPESAHHTDFPRVGQKAEI